jgi:AraC family transcriptional regulator
MIRMNEFIIRIVKLEPMRVAYYRAISKTPEEDAIKTIRAWGEPKGFFSNPAKHYHFGYNNPHPNPADPKGEYGYECLISISSDVKPEGDIKIKEIPGGLYAVARCKGAENITPTWFYLFNEWLKNSYFELDEDNVPGLEELITPLEPLYNKWIFDLYLPIREKK